MLNELVSGICWERNKQEFTTISRSNSERVCMKKTYSQQRKFNILNFFVVRKMAENINSIFILHLGI